MELSALQKDALTEIANIGISKAATQLSLLLSDAVDIEIPDVKLITLDQLNSALELQTDEEVAAVYQKLSGHIEGRAILLFHSNDSQSLIKALVGSVAMVTGAEMRAFEHEAIMEIANIIISSCISVMADMLMGEITLSVPEYIESTLNNIIESDHSESGDEIKVLILKTILSAAQRDVSGTLMITITVNTIEAILKNIESLIAKNDG